MKTALIVLAAIAGLTLLSFGLYTCNQAKEHVTDNAFNSYEDFQEIYNTCVKVDSDLCSMQRVDEKDKMFDQFSKTSRVMGLKQQLTRWTGEYNAKSKMWNRSMWKSKTLPYQLQPTDFNCY